MGVKVVVVSAAVVDFDNHLIVLAQRSGKTSYPFCWCTPGGKVEPGESHARALRRELDEELGVHLDDLMLVNHVVYEHEIQSTRTGKMVEVVCYALPHTAISGTYKCLDGTIGVGWFDAATLAALPLAAADAANRAALLNLIGDVS